MNEIKQKKHYELLYNLNFIRSFFSSVSFTMHDYQCIPFDLIHFTLISFHTEKMDWSIQYERAVFFTLSIFVAFAVSLMRLFKRRKLNPWKTFCPWHTQDESRQKSKPDLIQMSWNWTLYIIYYRL